MTRPATMPAMDWVRTMSTTATGLVHKARLARRRQRFHAAGAAARSITREQVCNRDVVIKTLVQHGLNVDSVSEWYREVYRRLARVEVAFSRLGLISGLGLIVSMIAFWRVTGAYFGEAPDMNEWLLSGVFGYLIVSVPVIVWLVLRRRLPALDWVLLLIFSALLVMMGLIVFGEVKGVGPVHAFVGQIDSRNKSMYVMVKGVLTYEFLIAVALFAVPVTSFVRRRALLAHPMERALRALFISIALSASDDIFLRTGTRRRLAILMRDLSLIARVGLWKVVRPPSVLARSVLRHRCELAAQSMEMMCVWVALPAKTTRIDFVYRMCCLVDTLLSGRLDELPVEPDRNAVSFQRRITLIIQFGRTVLIGVLPLVMLEILGRFEIVPPDPVNDPLKGVFWIWFGTALLTALGELRTGRTFFQVFMDLLAHVRGGSKQG
jgi:hypothetical protein